MAQLPNKDNKIMRLVVGLRALNYIGMIVVEPKSRVLKVSYRARIPQTTNSGLKRYPPKEISFNKTICSINR